MKTLATSVLALSLAAAAGCGGSYYSNPQCGSYSYPCQEVYDSNHYIIDAGAALELPQNAIGIATDGVGWTVTWQGDRFARRFQGTISGPPGSVITQSTVPPSGPNQIIFDDVSVALDPGTIQFRINAQPVLFDLYIDGAPAVGNTVFVSGGDLGTTNYMPFYLSTTRISRTFGKDATVAPQFTPKAPEEGQAETTFTVRPPGPKLEAGIRPPRSASTTH
jgi:hypothetical protein